MHEPPKSLDDLLNELNPQQREAVTAPPGPVLVWAGPGSGKTRVLTYRIAYLVLGLGVSPWNILAVTFTNKAAREMKERLGPLLGIRAENLTVGTFHAFCARFLRLEHTYHPFGQRFVIADTEDQRRLLKQAMKDMEVSEVMYPLASVHAAISRAKNEGIWPKGFPTSSPRQRTIARIYHRYQELLLASKAMDFDDLLLWAVRILEENPGVRKKWAERYQHILVDEFQDTNMLQYQLARLLAQEHRNLFVVGDMDQAIYSWRGADYRNLERFQKDFPEARTIPLEENYRSTQHILDAALGVIRPLHRRPKRLFTRKGRGAKVTLKYVNNPYDEADFVIETLLALTRRGEARLGDFAIMYRTNAQSRVLEERFLAHRVPYHVVGTQRFYGRKEVKDLLAYLRLAYNPEDESSLLRVINVPPRGIGMKTLALLRSLARRMGYAPGMVLLELARKPEAFREGMTGRSRRVLMQFASLLAELVELGTTLSPLELLDWVLEHIAYRAYLEKESRTSEEFTQRWSNVEELRRLAGDYPAGGLEAFLEDVALVSDQDTLGDEGAPTLLTLHAAKGLEFPIVFIVGLVEGLLPHSRSTTQEQVDEERRLFYVGITRAKERLYLVVPESRWAFGEWEPLKPSRFLQDLPVEVLTGDVDRLFPKAVARRRQRQKAAPMRPPVYRKGMRVRHPRWGLGTVVDVEDAGGDQILMITFTDGRTRPFLASMAPLEPVD